MKLEKNDINKFYEDAMYQHFLSQGYTEFQAKVMVNKITQKSVYKINYNPEQFSEESEQEDDIMLPVDEQDTPDMVLIQADEKTIDQIIKRKKSFL